MEKVKHLGKISKVFRKPYVMGRNNNKVRRHVTEILREVKKSFHFERGYDIIGAKL